MRKLLYLIVLLYSSFIVAQNNGITYQAVIYHPNGQNIPGQNIQNTPMANKLICLQFSLIDDQSQVEYKETIQTTTDAFGMVNLLIGSGTQTGGYATTFETVDWTTQTKSLKVELDTRGTCQEFIELSDNPLSTVPYAFSAQTANAISGIVAIENGGTGAANATEAKTNLGLGNVDNTSDLNKPISTATQNALNTKEDLLNKSTNVSTDGTSDIKYPSAKAVKDYVDGSIAIATIPDATTTVKGKIKLAGDLGGTADLPTVPGLANKENTANKSAVTTLGNSDILFPTQNAVKTYVDTNITSVNTANTALQATVTANATATTNALALKENTANKSAVTTLGNSDVLFPTQNAVKTYVDTNISTVNSANSTLQATVTANANNTTAALALKENTANKSAVTTLGNSDVLFPTQNAVKTYVDSNISTVNSANNALQATVTTNATNTTATLALKENTANKSAVTTLGNSDVLFPTQNAVKTYVDTQVASATIADADATTKGKIKLSGDLGGTADSPTVPGLANKENTIAVGTITDYYRGDKTWQVLDKSAVGLGNINNTSDLNKPISSATQTALDLKENIANKSGDIYGDANSTTKYPTVKAIKDYVDTLNAAAGVADGSITSTKIADGTIMNIDVNANAAIAYSKLNLNNSIVTTDIADTAVSTSKIANTAVTTTKIADANVTPAKIAAGNNNTVLVTDNTGAVAWIDATAFGAVADLTTIDGAGTIASPFVVKDLGIITAKLANGAVTTAKLADDAVETAKIKDINVTTAKLAPNAVTTSKISDANVTNAKLDKVNIPLSGFGAAIADVDLGSNKLTNVTNPSSAQDAATKSYVDTATSSITTLTDGKIYVGNATNEATQVTPTGDVTITNAGVTAIGTSKVVTTMLAADAVTSAKITDGTIVVGDLADDAVETTKIKDANVTTAKLADDAVETAKIKNANVTNAKLDKTNIPLSGFGAAIADVDLGSNKLTGVADPTAAQDAATKSYVDTATSSITTLTDGKIYVGNATNEATQVTPTGDVTITNAGVTAIGTSKVVTAMLAADAVTSAKITDGTIVVGDLADDAVETTKIKDANVTTAKLADDAVETAKIKNANVTNAKLDKTNIPLSGFGAATADVALGSNKLTGVADPTAAQDAATKSYVDSQISTGVVDATTTVKGKVQLAGDLTGTAASPTVATGAITTAKLAADAVTSAKITDGTIVVGDLADDAVETTKIKDANVTTAKLADDAVETAKIKNANVTNAKLDKTNIPLSGFGAATADVALGSNKLTGVADPTAAQDAATKNYVDTATSNITTLTDGKIYVGNASNAATQVTPTGDVTITNAGVTAIGTGKVVTAMLADTAVTTAKITDANVTTAKLADNAVETAKIKNANVTNAKLDKANIPLSGFGTATADVDLGSNKLTNVTDPASAQDAATKNYVDTATSGITTLDDGKIYLGNASNVATEVTPTGDVTITNAGVTAIGTGKVVTAMLATDAVETAKIKDANVTTAKLADNAVETAKIKNANVTNAKLDKANIPLSGFGAAIADVDLGSNKLTNVTDPASAQDAATKNYVDTATSSITTLTDGKIYVGNASNAATQVTPTGDVTITNAGVTAIGTGKVVTAMLADTAVTTAKITDANVTTAKLADNAVETAKIKNAAVTTAKIADANVTYAKIQNVSATDKVLGRVSTGAGVIEEIATTGTGNVVRATSPTLVTPNLGTPSAIDLTNATGLPIATAVTGILDVANGGTGSATQNFVDLTTNQTIAGVKTFSGSSTVVNQNLTVNAAGTTGQGIILSDDGDIVDNNDGAATFRFTGGVKINDGNKSAGTTTKITLANTGNINASGNITGSQIVSNVATGTAPLVVTSTTPVANLSIGGNAATATKLAATKNINGVAFDGSTDITVATAANTLTGTTLASNVVNSSLTSVGTITAGTWNGTTIAIANGGTGQTTKASAFDALSPMTSTGDIIYGGASGTGTRLAKGTDGQVLVLASGVPKWSNNIGGGVLSKSASYTILDTDNANYVVFSGSTASQTITLPSAVTAGAGREITIKSIASVSVTINATAGKLISDSTTTTATSLTIGIEPSNNWIKAISDGTNWIILRALF